MEFAESIQRRTYTFAISVVRFCRTLPHTDEAREIARQLLMRKYWRISQLPGVTPRAISR